MASSVSSKKSTRVWDSTPSCPKCGRPLYSLQSREEGICAFCFVPKRKVSRSRSVAAKVSISLVEVLAKVRKPIVATKLASLSGSPYSTIARYLRSLEKHGIIQRVGKERTEVPGHYKTLWESLIRHK